MIRIKKPQQAPRVLREQGAEQTRTMCAEYDANPVEYNSGRKKFTFNKFYNHKTVKEALIKAQHGKCCYCESNFAHVAFGDVEHYRPKKGYRQKKGGKLHYPGYYWLAYEWSNLLASCQLCNQQFKKNLFHLKDEGNRARNHHHDISLEEPLLINPAETNPEQHISFREEIAYAPANSIPGATTIDTLQLNKESLAEYRRKYLHQVRLIHELLDKIKPSTAKNRKLLQDARSFLNSAVQDNAEYAGMIRAYFKSQSM